MQAGTLNTRITIQRLSGASDELGQPVAAWVDVATVWADVRHNTGLGAIRAGGEVSVVKASVRIRRRDDLTAGMRVVVGPTVYQIEAVPPPVARQEHTDLVCQVVT